MFTNWHQIEDFIKDNGAEKWVIARTDPARRSGDATTFTDKIVDSSLWKDRTLEQKLDLTRRVVEAYGERCYIQLYASEGSTRATTMMEICLASTPQVAAPVPLATVSGVDEATLKERIRKEFQIEYDKREYDRKHKEFEEEKRQFEADKASLLGAVIGYLKPYLPALNAAISGGRHVAGLDSPDDVEAARIHAVDPDEPDTRDIRDDNETIAPEEQSPFTDEEADQLFALMARFKAVEPENYLRLIARMVEMAESNDPMYGMAKGFLLK